MTIFDKERYSRYRYERNLTDKNMLYDLWLPMLLFGSMGAITWAIRGTTGWGGIDGTIVPGLTWGLLWYYIFYRRGVDARGIVLWLGLGLALGGELGYGQYVSWILGNFYAGDEVYYIQPWKGYAWFVICGIGWAAPGGVMLGWALNSKVSVLSWITRVFLAVLLLVIIFNLSFSGKGVVDRLGAFLVQNRPGLLFPNAELDLYAGLLDNHLGRTVYTNTQNFLALIWWLVALCVAAFQHDRATFVSAGILGGGFGIGFALSALWCLGYSYDTQYIDWWKMWELQAGFFLGLLYVIVMYRAARHLDTTHDNMGTPSVAAGSESAKPAVNETTITLFLAFSGFVLVFAASEYFFWTGLLLALFYMAAMIAVTFMGNDWTPELRKRVSLIYSTFLLLFILFHGAMSRTGVFLELYDAESVSQYAWPPGRIALFVPVAGVLLLITLIKLFRAYRLPANSTMEATQLPEKMTDLFTFTGIIGAISIWPSKITVLYSIFLFFALYAFTRINRYYMKIGL